MHKYTLCGRGACCPTLIDNEDGTFTITDDYGGKVKLTKEQLIQLQALRIYNEDSSRAC
jgi:hypothetical protein